jgi:trimeric autotransporter adhesin
MSKYIWRGDLQAVPQISDVFFQNIEGGDYFTLTINRKDITIQASEDLTDLQLLINDVVSKFVISVGQFSHPTLAEFREISAATLYNEARVVIGMRLTGPADGKPFTITGSTSNSDNLAIVVTQIRRGDPGRNERQVIQLASDVTGGTFTLTFDGQTTGNIAYNASSATVTTELEALSNIASGDVTVTGSNGGPWTIEFKQVYASQDVPSLVPNGANLTISGGYVVAVETVQQGDAGKNQIQQITHRGTGGTVTDQYSANATWTCPAGITSATVECWGAGGGGGSSNSTIGIGFGGSGGGGGAYAKSVLSVTPTSGYAVVVGAGGAGGVSGGGGTGGTGGDSKFNTTDVIAKGGTGGTQGSTTPAPAAGVGGASGSSTGTVKYSGGSGGGGASNTSGDYGGYGGGSSAGTASNGTTGGTYGAGVGGTGGVAPSGGGNGGAGSFDAVGNAGTSPGGGGGGAGQTWNSSARSGGAGATGKVAITYVTSSFTLSFDGQTTAAIPADASAADVQSALEALSNIAPGDVTVTKPASGQWNIEFKGTYKNQNLAPIVGNGTNLTGASAVSISEKTQGYPGVNHVYRLWFVTDGAGATQATPPDEQVKLQFTNPVTGVVGTTIVRQAQSQAAIQNALENMVGVGNVVVRVDATAGVIPGANTWLVEFIGVLGSQNLNPNYPSSYDLTSLMNEGLEEAITSPATIKAKRVYLDRFQDGAATGRDEVQRVLQYPAATGGTFTLTFRGQTTGTLAYNISAASLKTALEALSTIDTVTVTAVTVAGGRAWDVEFDGPGAEDVPLMTADVTSLTGGAVSVGVTQAATAAKNEVQAISLIGEPAGGTFTLTFNGSTSNPIDFNASASDVATEFELSFDACIVTGSDGGPWNLEFTGNNSGLNVAQMTGSGASLSGSIPEVTVSQTAKLPVNEIQEVKIVGDAGGGTFTLTFNDGSGNQTTSAIAYNATPAAVKSALVALSTVGPNDLVVSGNAGGPWTIKFQNALAAEDFELITGTSSLTAGAGSQTISINRTQVPTGPNWANRAENWVPNAVPGNGDEMVFENSSVSCLYGIDQFSAITLAVLRAKASFTGSIGLPTVSGGGIGQGGYYEYRATSLAVNATLVEIGEGEGGGSPLIKLNTQSAACELIVHKLATPTGNDNVALYWKGSHASNVARVYRGNVGIAFEFDTDTATLPLLQIGYVDSQDSDATVYAGSGATITNVAKVGGSARFFTAPTNLENWLGDVEVLDGSGTTYRVHAGNFYYNGDDTITNYYGGSDSILNLYRSCKLATFTNCTIVSGAAISDPKGRVAWTNGIDLYECGIADVTLDLGKNFTLTPSVI